MRVPGEPAAGGLGIALDERAMARFVVESAGARTDERVRSPGCWRAHAAEAAATRPRWSKASGPSTWAGAGRADATPWRPRSRGAGVRPGAGGARRGRVRRRDRGAARGAPGGRGRGAGARAAWRRRSSRRRWTCSRRSLVLRDGGPVPGRGVVRPGGCAARGAVTRRRRPSSSSRPARPAGRRAWSCRPGRMAASAESWLAALPPATGWLLALGPGSRGGPRDPVARDRRARPGPDRRPRRPGGHPRRARRRSRR